ncbi:hypothetical protein IK146_01600 [Candidatus Saccharibacteria bacterium]|nr:hypothetical protein [Candidatus Saccharibacteria bacterium]
MSERILQCIDTGLFGKVCDYCDGGAIYKILAEGIEILTILIGAFAVISIIIVGVSYITSAGNPALQTKAKRRFAEIIIGIMCYSVFFAFAEFLIPGGIINSTLDTMTSSCPKEPEEPVTPTPPGEGEEEIPPKETKEGVSCADNPHTYEEGGFCYADTKIHASEYVKNACSKYHSCQSYKATSGWGSVCADMARVNAKEMIYGNPIVHEAPLRGGASVHTQTIPSNDNEDNSPMHCNGSVIKNSSSKVVNRNAFKALVKELVGEIMSGKPVSVAMGNKTYGKKYNGKVGRHFVTFVGVSSFVNTTNVDRIEVYFDQNTCIGENWDQPHIILDGKEVQFSYVDPWDAKLHTTGVKGHSRAWRFHYETKGWYIYKY